MKREKNVGPRMAHRVLVKMTSDEHSAITATARAVRLPVSTLLRKLALGYQPPSLLDLETLHFVSRLRGDLGRLGGLLKQYLLEEPGNSVPETEVRATLNMILEKQNELNDLTRQLMKIIPNK